MIEEVEIGPHFLTFYFRELNELIGFSEQFHPIFCREFPHLAEIQQARFFHEPDDSLIYHPYGEPSIIRKHFRHFHIRTFIEPDEDLTYQIIQSMERLKPDIFSDDYTITHLVHNVPEEYSHINYPAPPKHIKLYFDYIKELKTGAYRSTGNDD